MKYYIETHINILTNIIGRNTNQSTKPKSTSNSIENKQKRQVQFKSNIKINTQCSWQCSQRRRALVDIKSFPMSSATPPCLVQPICSQPRAFGSLHFVWCLVVLGIVLLRLVVEIRSKATAPTISAH